MRLVVEPTGATIDVELREIACGPVARCVTDRIAGGDVTVHAVSLIHNIPERRRPLLENVAFIEYRTRCGGEGNFDHRRLQVVALLYMESIGIVASLASLRTSYSAGKADVGAATGILYAECGKIRDGKLSRATARDGDNLLVVPYGFDDLGFIFNPHYGGSARIVVDGRIVIPPQPEAPVSYTTLEELQRIEAQRLVDGMNRIGIYRRPSHRCVCATCGHAHIVDDGPEQPWTIDDLGRIDGQMRIK